MTIRMIATTVTLLCMPAIARANDWVELRSDPQGSRTTSEWSGTSFTPSWTYTAKHGGQFVATPVSADGVVVVAGTGGDISALDIQSGAEKWTRTVDGGVGSTPAIFHGRVVTSTLGGQLYALDLASGDIGWQTSFGGGMNYSSPAIIDEGAGSGSVVVPAGFPSKDVSRVDLATGVSRWRTAQGDIADLLYTTPAIVGQQAIVGMNGGRYQSLDLATGATRWMFDATGDVFFASALVNGNAAYLFPGNSASQLYAVNVDTGSPISGYPISIPDPAPVAGLGMLGRGPATSPPMMAGGLIIVQLRRQDMISAPYKFKVAMREWVVAIDPRQLKVVWQHQLANVMADNVNGVPDLNTCPTPAGFASDAGTVIAVSSSISPLVAVLDVATGTERWSAPLSKPGRSSPIFSNGQLIVATDAGVVHAFSSTVNHAPTLPSGLLASGADTSGDVMVSWNAASDSDGDALSYRVRLSEDGAGATTETDTSPGQTGLSIALHANASYHVAVRSRDARGALSAWSTSRSIEMGAVAPTPAPVAAPMAPVAVAPTPAPVAAPMAPVVVAPTPAPVPVGCAPTPVNSTPTPAAPTLAGTTPTPAAPTLTDTTPAPAAPTLTDTTPAPAAPTKFDAPSFVTVFADPSVQLAAAQEPIVQPATTAVAVETPSAVTSSLAVPMVATAQTSMLDDSHATTTHDNGSATLAPQGGCSVVPRGGSAGGATGLAFALGLFVVAKRKRAATLL